MASSPRIGSLPPLLFLPPDLDRVPSADSDLNARCGNAAALLQQPHPVIPREISAAAAQSDPEEEAPSIQVESGPAAGLRPRKRKPAAPTSSDEEVQLTQKQEKRNRNRDSAHKYRENKKIYVSGLEAKNRDLEKRVIEQARTIVQIQSKVVRLTGENDELKGRVKWLQEQVERLTGLPLRRM